MKPQHLDWFLSLDNILQWCIFIFREFLAPGAHNPVNVEGRISELVRGRIENHVDRYCFEEAQVMHENRLDKTDMFTSKWFTFMYYSVLQLSQFQNKQHTFNHGQTYILNILKTISSDKVKKSRLN